MHNKHVVPNSGPFYCHMSRQGTVNRRDCKGEVTRSSHYAIFLIIMRYSKKPQMKGFKSNLQLY